MAEGQGRSSNQGVKLLYIRDYLHKNTNKEHPKNATEISDYLASKGIKADRKTIYNDILRLQVDFQEPIEYNPNKKGYYIAEPIFSLYELQILADCVRTSELLSAKEAASITKRISGLTNIYDCKQLMENAVWMLDPLVRPINSELYNVDIIKRAIEQNRKISFRYFAYNPTSSNRSIGGKEYLKSYTGNETFIASPKTMCYADDKYMLCTYCSDNRIKSITDYMFDVERMEDIVILPSDRECDDSFTPARELPLNDFDYICTQFLSFREKNIPQNEECELMKQVLIEAAAEFFDIVTLYADTYTTTLSFRKSATIHVLKEFGYDTTIVPEDDNEYCTATIPIKVDKRFFNWLFAQHTNIMIKAPIIVEIMYCEYIESISRLYKYKHMEPDEITERFMELMEERVKDKKLLKALQEQYIIVDDYDTSGN